MRLDAHQHFWNYTANPEDFIWMTGEYTVLGQNFLPTDLQPQLTATGFDGTIAVQAREMEVETDFLLGLAKENSIVKGVVGWVDLCASDVQQRLERFVGEPLLKGFRMLIHDQPDPDFANSDMHANGIGQLVHFNWTYDLLLRTIHLLAAIRLVDRFPNQKFVVDHIAKPSANKSDWDAWQQGIRAISERPNVYCKLSGLVTEGDWRNVEASTFMPFLDEVLGAFGPERCMVGSDWPVCTCAADYVTTMNVVKAWAAPLSRTEQSSLFGDTCAKFYDAA